MFSDPDVGAVIRIGEEDYSFAGVPDAPGIVYAEIGKRAKVYRLMQNGNSFALKVFRAKYRNENTVANTNLIALYKGIPGLMVAERTVLYPDKYKQLIDKSPSYAYSVLMPWITGNTWCNFILNKTPLTAKDSLHLTKALLNVLNELESRNIAHCDLSGGNFIFSPSFDRIQLIDIEELFGDGLVMPDPLPAGTGGYSADWIREKGLWESGADRFSAGILVSEILGWQFDEIRELASEGEAFFAEGEFGHKSHRYQLMKKNLNEIHADLSDLFDLVWNAKSVEDCPRIAAWKQVIDKLREPGGDHGWGWESLDLEDLMATINSSVEKAGLPETTSVHKDALSCSSCGKALHIAWSVCPECGNSIDKIDKTQETDNKPIDSDNEPEIAPQPWHPNQAKKAKQRVLIGFTTIFLVFGLLVTALILISGETFVILNNKIQSTLGYAFAEFLTAIELGFLISSVQSWILKDQIISKQRWMFILAALFGGAVSGFVGGVLMELKIIDNSIILGGTSGLIAGGISSIVQNALLKSKSIRLKWFFYSAISWAIIWGIGWTLSWWITGVVGSALAAGFILVASGITFSIFLNFTPQMEF